MDISMIIALTIGGLSTVCLVAMAFAPERGARRRSDNRGDGTGNSEYFQNQHPLRGEPAQRRSASADVQNAPSRRSQQRVPEPPRGDPKSSLRERLVQAGLYKKNSNSFFYFLQFVFGVIPCGVGFFSYTLGLLTIQQAAFMAAITGIAGVVAPGLWLDYCKSTRQTKLRRALPDALDVITVCVEAGLSFNSAIIHVGKELVTAHPMLAMEMMIVHREIQMGNSTGEALKNFAARFDVEELRSLASVVEQSERFGASISAALKVYAESLRVKRMQMAQTRAQKAAVKLLFPTVICIFPALLVVILGPAAFEIFEMLQNMN